MNSVMVNIAGQSVPCNADIRHNRAFDGMKVALRSAHHRRMVGKVGDEATNDFVAETIKKALDAGDKKKSFENLQGDFDRLCNATQTDSHNIDFDMAQQVFETFKKEANIIASSSGTMLLAGRVTSRFIPQFPVVNVFATALNGIMRLMLGKKMGDNKINRQEERGAVFPVSIEASAVKLAQPNLSPNSNKPEHRQRQGAYKKYYDAFRQERHAAAALDASNTKYKSAKRVYVHPSTYAYDRQHANVVMTQAHKEKLIAQEKRDIEEKHMQDALDMYRSSLDTEYGKDNAQIIWQAVEELCKKEKKDYAEGMKEMISDAERAGNTPRRAYALAEEHMRKLPSISDADKNGFYTKVKGFVGSQEEANELIGQIREFLWFAEGQSIKQQLARV